MNQASEAQRAQMGAVAVRKLLEAFLADLPSETACVQVSCLHFGAGCWPEGFAQLLRHRPAPHSHSPLSTLSVL